MGRTIHDRSIVITGASSGIGRSTALACAAAGMDIILNARRADRLEDVAAQIERAGRRAIVVAGDCTDVDVMREMLDRAERDTSGLYAVFANAGVGMNRTIVDMTMTELRDLYEINFFSSAHLLQDAARRLRAAKAPGHLMMCSSCLSKFGIGRHGAYSGSKAAQNHLCRAMRHELYGTGIEVASVHPITTRTEFFEVSDARSQGDDPSVRGMTAMPKFYVQSPERVARAVVRCLRHPRPEVWTSWTMRMASAFITAFPSSLDLALRFGAIRRMAGDADVEAGGHADQADHAEGAGVTPASAPRSGR
ncbi:MAG: SDR family NAD(P)-dependent oxidoreductase [Phycisphaerales bacterium]|nr:SDR family NAD(P)-dependent oxidoreductase [Phycisphaerales bacterium]